MDPQLKYLKSRAAECYKGLIVVLESLNRDYPKPDTRWEMDEINGSVRRVKLPTLEWEELEEPNDRFDNEDQERFINGSPQ